MCEHLNLRTVGDRLFCKDCKQELPLEFLYRGQEAPEEAAPEAPEAPEEVNQEAEPDVVMDAAAVEIEPAEVMEEQTVSEPAVDVQEAPQALQEAGQNAPDGEEHAVEAPKKERAKTARKTGKNGGV